MFVCKTLLGAKFTEYLSRKEKTISFIETGLDSQGILFHSMSRLISKNYLKKRKRETGTRSLYLVQRATNFQIYKNNADLIPMYELMTSIREAQELYPYCTHPQGQC